MVITVSQDEWGDSSVRARTLAEARRQAQSGKSKVIIKTKGKRGKMTVATVNGRWFKP